MTTGQRDMGVRFRPSVRSTAAFAVVVLSPVVAWVTWISWSEYKASDTMTVLWFVTAALGCLAAGGLAAGTALRPAVLIVTAVVATMTTLSLWWSSEDSTGLFGVGIVVATFIVVPAAAALVGLGYFVGYLVRSPTGQSPSMV